MLDVCKSSCFEQRRLQWGLKRLILASFALPYLRASRSALTKRGFQPHTANKQRGRAQQMNGIKQLSNEGHFAFQTPPLQTPSCLCQRNGWSFLIYLCSFHTGNIAQTVCVLETQCFSVAVRLLKPEPALAAGRLPFLPCAGWAGPMSPAAFEIKAPGFASKVIRYFSLGIRGDEMLLLEQHSWGWKNLRVSPASVSELHPSTEISPNSSSSLPMVVRHHGLPSGGVTIPSSTQEVRRCGTEGHGLLGVVQIGWWLDYTILLVFSNLDDSDSKCPIPLEKRDLVSCLEVHNILVSLPGANNILVLVSLSRS